MVVDEPTIQNEFGFEEILQGFKNMKVKIIPIFEDLEKMGQKKKFKELFDVVTIGFI